MTPRTPHGGAVAAALRAARRGGGGARGDLAASLRELAPGERIVVLGRRCEEVAQQLAEGGYDVLVLDARRRGDREPGPAGVGQGAVRWAAHDVLTAEPWPCDRVDAIVLAGGLPSGADAVHRRVLRTARRHLAAGGVLLVEHGDGSPVAHPSSTDGPSPRHSSAEMRATLRRCGYEPLPHVAARDATAPPADSTGNGITGRAAGARDATAERTVARPAAIAPAHLAVAQHTCAGDAVLDLRWAPDEGAYLAPSPMSVWEERVATSSREAGDHARSYALDDPYGSRRAASVVAEHHGARVPSDCVTFGAGVTALLRELAGLADGGVVLTHRLVHPDLPAWARSAGAEIVGVPATCDLRELHAAVARLRPQVVLVDRPSLPGQLAPGAAVRELADAACEVGAVVVVDEAYATYLGPPASCAPLVARLHNLVVLRSLSKGYGWGGLRAGYCVSSAALTERLRELVTPLATSSLSLAAALALLGAGDAFAALRARVREVKPLVSARLAELGIAHAHGHEELPWLLLDDRGVGARARLAALGVGVRPVLDGATGRAADHAKLCLPISAERLARFDELTRP